MPDSVTTGQAFAVSQTPRVALADWRRRIFELYADVRGQAEPQAAWRHWRDVRSGMFRDHPMSPVPEDQRSAFESIPFFPYDPALRFEAGLVPLDAEVELVELGADGTLRQRPVARTDGLARALGAELTLYWIEGYGGGLFLPFKDGTNGDETYGGGRYLIDAIKGADLGQSAEGRLVLDFNFAYHPSCALNPAWVCPLSPPANTLPLPIRAGELLKG